MVLKLGPHLGGDAATGRERGDASCRANDRGEVPRHFNVMLDRMMHASEHYIARLCCFKKDGELVTGLAPLTNEPNDDLSARTHLEFLAKMLPRDYAVQIEQCCSLIENCLVNRLFATLMGYHWWAALAAA
ncbi:hypothetical protein GQ600_19263 [Phytophthora cactorum]|nr:hypothetical protein GQ600_19263 [Phytophthora cactorum]